MYVNVCMYVCVCVFVSGVAERHPWKKTETKRKQNSTPKFDDEIVFFNITDPGQFIFQEVPYCSCTYMYCTYICMLRC